MNLTSFDRSGIIDTGLDWLTVTQVSGTQSEAMLDTIRQYIADNYPADAIPKSWRAMGYQGQNYGQLKFGRRKADESIMILSGSEAERFGVNFRIPEDRVTRIDLQVTLALGKPMPMMAHNMYRRLIGEAKTKGHSAKVVYHSSEKGDTITVGSRGSATFLRLYDKSADYNVEPTGSIWRYEVEFKQSRAKSATREVQQAISRYEKIAARVWAEFNSRGIAPHFRPQDRMSAMEAGVKISTPDTKLGWLERCVAPVVTQLIQMGYEREVINSLRLRGIYRKE